METLKVEIPPEIGPEPKPVSIKPETDPETAPDPTPIKGVLSTCSGHYEEVIGPIPESFSADIPPTSPIFTHGLTAPNPAKIGLHILAHKQSTPFSDRFSLTNYSATFLMLSVDTGAPLPGYQDHVGDVLFARRDQKPFSVSHFEALVAWNERIWDVLEEHEDNVAGQAMVTRSRWDAFWEEYKQEQVAIIKQSYRGDGAHPRQDEIDAWTAAINPLLV